MKRAKYKITLSNGADFLVYDQNSKFWICENTQFRKSNPAIVKVEKIKKSTNDTDTEPKEETICL